MATTSDLSPNFNTDVSSSLGLGGVPFGAGFPLNGGLPSISLTGNALFGSSNASPSLSGQDVYQIQDNLTKVYRNNTFKMGVVFQSIRFNFLNPSFPKGQYVFNGRFTSKVGTSNTGFSVADFLIDQMFSSVLANSSSVNDVRWYRAGYFQDDWKIAPELTLNLGLRYDYFQPPRENAGRNANFVPTSLGIGTGTATFSLPLQSQSQPLSPAFLSILSANRVALQYQDNPSLVNAQHDNIAPRVGFSYSIYPKTVVRGGVGLFFGGLEDRGGNANLGYNYPFQFANTFAAPTCKLNNCASNGLTLEKGFTAQLAAGLQNSVTTPSFAGYDPNYKTPYSEQYNLTVEHSFSNTLVGSVAYVGNQGRHLQVVLNPDSALALGPTGTAIAALNAFSTIATTSTFTSAIGSGNYNGLQTRLEKRLTGGLQFLTTYTWSHALDNAFTPLNNGQTTGFRNTSLIPINNEYANAETDTRHRVTFNGFYQLPFGNGQRYLNHRGLLNELLGGVAADLVFTAQTGQPISISPDTTTAAGGTAYAILKGDPYKAGGVPDPSNPGVVCPTQVRTPTHWYNPCAFANPPAPPTSNITDTATAITYLGGKRNQISGPGYERINMSFFKRFVTFREQYLEMRVDAFNVLNTPAYGIPDGSINSAGGLITSPLFFQPYNPDARFFQIAAKYEF